jgi:hypothetical protein
MPQQQAQYSSTRSARLSSVTGGCRDTFTIINTGIIIKLILLYIWIWEYNVVIAHVGTGIYILYILRACASVYKDQVYIRI